MRPTPPVQLFIVPFVLLLLAVSNASSAPMLYYTEVASVPAGAYVCAGGRDFPGEAGATVYLDAAKTCSVTSFTHYTASGWTVGTATGHVCIEMPTSGTCAAVDSFILNDGSSDSNALSLSRHSGTVYWVDDSSGSDSNSCTSNGNDCETIRGALNKSGFGDGDVVVVRGGIYTDLDIPGQGGSALYISSSRGDPDCSQSLPCTVQGYPNEFPTVRNNGTEDCAVAIYMNQDWWQITGMTATGADGNGDFGRSNRWGGNKLIDGNQDECISDGSPAASGLYVDSDADDGFFLGNDSNDNGCCNTNLDHGLYHQGDRWTVAYNEFARNSFGITVFGSSGGQSDNLFYSNHIHDNTNGAGVGLHLGGGSRNNAYNNVIHDNGGQGFLLQYGSPSDHQIFNNTIYNNGSSCILLVGASDTMVENNICHSNGSDSIAQSSSSGTVANNNYFGNPSFVNAGNGDFSLQSGSSAIDAGTSPPSSRSSDFENSPAPQNGTHDIGALEFHDGGGPTSDPPPVVTNLRRSDTSGSSP